MTQRRLIVSIGSIWLVLVSGSALAADLFQPPGKAHEFYFTRGVYTSYFNDDFSGQRWRVDFPEADQHYLTFVRRLTGIDAFERQNPIRLTDPNLRRFPFLYVLEVGYWNLTDAEIEALAGYVNAGGFLVVDDFWGTWAWENFERHIKRILPDRVIEDVPMDHPIFHIFYDMTEIIQVPNVRQGQLSVYGGPTHEYDGVTPHVRGIFDDDGRLMVLINWNTDLGDAWEHADDPYYPLKFSTYSFEMGVNFAIYAMTY